MMVMIRAMMVIGLWIVTIRTMIVTITRITGSDNDRKR